MDTKASAAGSHGGSIAIARESGSSDPARAPITLISRDGLIARGIDYSRSHLWRLEQQKRFPRRVRLGSTGRVAWIQAEVDEYLSQLAAARP